MDSENVQVIKSINANDLDLYFFKKYDESNHSMHRSKYWPDQLQSSKAVLWTHSQLICSTAVQDGSS